MSKFYLDWQQRAIKDGHGFHVTVGAFSTPIQGGGSGTVIDADQPEFIVSVPSGTTIMPVRVSVQCQTPLLATDADESEIVLAWDLTAAWDTTGTSTAEVAYNSKTGHGRTSLCSIESKFTADITTVPVSTVELARAVITGDMNGTPANALWGQLDLLYAPHPMPMMTGPCMLIGYWGGTVATNGFAQIHWLEFATSDVA